MRKCLRCGADMIEGCGINVKRGAYGISVTWDENHNIISKFADPKVAICPECGEISLYIEDTEPLKNGAYYRDFNKEKRG